MGAIKTPGVYVFESDTPVIVEVATAVPAFVGYTEKADDKGQSLSGKPWRITSFAEFESYFGGAPDRRFDLALKTGAAAPAVGAAPEERKPIVIEQGDYSLAQAGNRHLLYDSMRLFYENGGGPCYVVSVGSYTCPIRKDDLANGIEALVKEREPTLVAIPEAVMLDTLDDCMAVQQAALRHCGLTMKNRVAILDVFNGDKEVAENPIVNFRSKLGVDFLGYGAAYYPWLNTTVASPRDFGFANVNQADELKTLIAQELKGGTPEQQAELARIVWSDREWTTEAARQNASVADLKMRLGQTLAAMSQRYKSLVEQMAAIVNVLPPSAALAGVYTRVDAERGVWKAPANVSLAAVASPTVDVTQYDQEDMNVTATGKSVNALRSFVGEGLLVWGARTLDGNSLDWRYINVRRTIIMLEESIRLAVKACVFEPNVVTTWVTVKRMIRNFLTGIWKKGGLAGAVPDDAFQILVGLGETMTPEDILEGILRVSVLIAVSRPAEFVEITFQQQMQKS